MPVGVIKADLAKGSLVKIRLEDIPEGMLVMAMSAVFRTDRPPGPAGRWLIERLKSNIAPRAIPAKTRRRPRAPAAGMAK
jgi:DNA-binding transcriptional LysR family regulator